MLTNRWNKLRYHEKQAMCYRSTARFNINHSGRRSGKTELEKRKRIMRFIDGAIHTTFPDYCCFIGAPVRHQAKKIYWSDLKALVPKKFVSKIDESNLIIYTILNSQLHVVGMDRPERIEGVPWDDALLDEYGNMKPDTWEEHVRPALSDRKGSCAFIGAPEGRNHYYDLVQRAKANIREKGEKSTWNVWHWPSWEILDTEEIEAAKREMDSLIFRQEYGGEFISFSGNAYYPFNEELHVGVYRDCYQKQRPLVLCFDFNVAPGTAVILQELGSDVFDVPFGTTISTAIDEVYIPRNSNTLRVCNKILEKYSKHEGLVICYGDATGGSSGTAKVKGNDWDLIKQALYPHFADRLYINVPLRNPAERQRVNAVNSRLLTMSGVVKLVIDGKNCPMLIKDLEGVRVIEGSAGEIDKKSDPKLTHLSDALGYYIWKEFPVGRYFTSEDMAAMAEDEYKHNTAKRLKAA